MSDGPNFTTDTQPIWYIPKEIEKLIKCRQHRISKKKRISWRGPESWTKVFLNSPKGIHRERQI